MGLLTTDFLAVLPNDDDKLNQFYKPLQDEIVPVMTCEPFVPTHSRDYAPAGELVQGPADIKKVITDDELPFFYGRKIIRWAATVRPQSREERFLRTLQIKNWSWDDLIRSTVDRFARSNDEWLRGRSDEWMQSFYALLNEATEKSYYSVKSAHIVRLQGGDLVCGEGVYFPDSGKKEVLDGLPIVRSIILQMGNNEKQIEKARSFLLKVGAREAGDHEEIQMILDKFYAPKKQIPATEKHLRHVRLFVSWWLEQKSTRIFDNYSILLESEGKRLCKPQGLYLDLPYADTGLSKFFGMGEKKGSVNIELWHGYEAIKSFLGFAQALGVMSGLPFKKIHIPLEHSDRTKLLRTTGKRTDSEIDEDWTIEGVQRWLKHPEHEMSKLIWKTVSHSDARYQQAQYRPNSQCPKNTAPSTLVYQLKQHKWIPDKKGSFRAPGEMTRDDLPADFPYDDRNGWLTAIGFGEQQKKQSEDYQRTRQALKDAGIPTQIADDLLELSESEREEAIREFGQDIRRRKQARSQKQSAISNDAELLDYGEALRKAFTRESLGADSDAVYMPGDVADPERRRSRIADDIKEDIENEPAREIRFKRVPRKIWESQNSEVRVFLEKQYQGKCQICDDTFLKRNGKPYFEGVYIVSYTGARWIDKPGNVLCLCATCCAKFQHGPVEEEQDIVEQIRSFKARKEGGEGQPCLMVKLCGSQVKIRFTEKHLLDLQGLVQTSSEKR